MTCQTIYTLNALTLLMALDDPAYGEVLARADLVMADGVGAVWAARRLTGKPPDRVTGVDLIQDLCAVCAREGRSVYLLGGRPGVAARAAAGLAARHPGLRVAGVRDGFWPETDAGAVVEAINATGAELLLVGLGQPRQELFLDRHRERLAAHLGIGVGGSFDVLAGDLRRAPGWVQRVGGEWLYRGLQEPWRWRRLARLPRFVWRVLRMEKHNVQDSR